MTGRPSSLDSEISWVSPRGSATLYRIMVKSAATDPSCTASVVALTKAESEFEEAGAFNFVDGVVPDRSKHAVARIPVNTTTMARTARFHVGNMNPSYRDLIISNATFAVFDLKPYRVYVRTEHKAILFYYASLETSKCGD